MANNVKARYTNGALVPLEPLDLEEGAGSIGVGGCRLCGSVAQDSPAEARVGGGRGASAGNAEGYSPRGVERPAHRPGQEQETLPLRPPQGRGLRAMGVVFADAGYWIALWRDPTGGHGTCHSHSRSSQMVLTERLMAMAGIGGIPRTFAGAKIHKSMTHTVEVAFPQTDAQFQAALERYASPLRPDVEPHRLRAFIVMEAARHHRGVGSRPGLRAGRIRGADEVSPGGHHSQLGTETEQGR